MLIINIHYQNILFSTLNNFKKDKIAADYVKLLPRYSLRWKPMTKHQNMYDKTRFKKKKKSGFC